MNESFESEVENILNEMRKRTYIFNRKNSSIL